MTYNYGVYDSSGRLWGRTLTEIRAKRLVKELFKEKGLVCHIKPLNNI